MSFKQWLIEGGEGSGRPDDGKRPKKSLWFGAPAHWFSDIKNSHGADNFDVVNSSGQAVTLSGGEEEEFSQDLYAVDKEHSQCFGAWRPAYKKGITFEKPRPLKLVKKRRKN